MMNVLLTVMFHTYRSGGESQKVVAGTISAFTYVKIVNTTGCMFGDPVEHTFRVV